MNAKDWVEIASGLGTVVATGIAVFTLLEMRAQRRAAYGPSIAINDGRFCAEFSEIPRLLTQDNEGSEPFHIVGEESILRIEPVNVGLGPAHRIRAEWIIDYSEVADKLNDAGDRKSQLAVANGALRLEGLDGRLIEQAQIVPVTEIRYLMPGDRTSQSPYMDLPEAYALVCSHVLRPFYDEDYPPGYYHVPLPPLTMRLSYRDVGRNRRQETYDLSLGLNVHVHEKDDYAMRTGYGTITVTARASRGTNGPRAWASPGVD